jgi:hypothetical protein
VWRFTWEKRTKMEGAGKGMEDEYPRPISEANIRANPSPAPTVPIFFHPFFFLFCYSLFLYIMRGLYAAPLHDPTLIYNSSLKTIIKVVLQLAPQESPTGEVDLINKKDVQ